MELKHTFTVPVDVDTAFAVLRDVERIAPCIPGASIDEVSGEEFKGSVKVKVGPVTVSYRGTARFEEIDEANHWAKLKASGREQRGSGTANATVLSELVDKGGETEVTMTTDLAITGKPAQFGRGVMNDVGNKLVTRFADCLAGQLQGDAAGAAVDTGDGQASAAAGDGQAASAPAGQPQPAGAPAGSATPPSMPSPVYGDPALATSAATQGAQAPLGQAQVAAPQPAQQSQPLGAATGQPAPAQPAPAQPQRQPQAEPEALDLFDVAGGAVLKRVAPVAGAIAALLIIWSILRRRRV